MPSLDIVSVLLTLFVDSPEAFSWKGLQDLTGMEVAPFSDQCTAEDVDMSDVLDAFQLKARDHARTPMQVSLILYRLCTSS